MMPITLDLMQIIRLITLDLTQNNSIFALDLMQYIIKNEILNQNNRQGIRALERRRAQETAFAARSTPSWQIIRGKKLRTKI